jgi:hypothetical protein
LFVSTSSSYRNHAFIRAAQALSMDWLLLCDTAVIAEYADSGMVYNPDDYPALISALTSRHQQHPFVSCMALDDSGAHIAQQIASDLGLPHNSAIATEAARNKYAMRLALQTSDIPLPWFRRFVSSDDIARITATVPYPCVIKPLELNGSRGVMRADTPAQLVIAQPSLLLGERKSLGQAHRPGEALAQRLAPLYAWATPLRWRPILAEHVATGLLRALSTKGPGTHRVLSDELFKLAR